MHLTPGAPDTKTGGHNVLTIRTLWGTKILITLWNSKLMRLMLKSHMRHQWASVLHVIYLDAISVSKANSYRQDRGGHTQRYSTGGKYGRAAYVTYWEATGFPNSCWHCAGKARAAPEAIAAWNTSSFKFWWLASMTISWIKMAKCGADNSYKNLCRHSMTVGYCSTLSRGAGLPLALYYKKRTIKLLTKNNCYN